MKLIPFFFVALLMSSCNGQNNPNDAAILSSITESINNGQPQTQPKVPVYNFLSVKLIPAPDPSLQVSEYIRCMIQDKKGNIWFGTNNEGVCRYDGERFFYYAEKDGLAGNAVRRILEDKKGNIWLATNNGVSMYNGTTFTRFSEADGLSSNDTWSMLLDSKDQLWVGTMEGVCVYNGTSFTKVDVPVVSNSTRSSRFTTKLVWSMYEDKSGNIWFGTNGDGVVDSADAISSGVIFTSGMPFLSAVTNGGTGKIVTDTGSTVTKLTEKGGGGSRRIMWRQIQ